MAATETGRDVTERAVKMTKESTGITGSTEQTVTEGSDVTERAVKMTKESTGITGSTEQTVTEGSDVTERAVKMTKESTGITGSTEQTVTEGSDVTGSTAETKTTKEGSGVTGSTLETTKEGSHVTGSSVQLTKDSTGITGSTEQTVTEGSDVTGSTAETKTTKERSDLTGSTEGTTKERSDVTRGTAETTKEGSDVTRGTAETTKEGSDVTRSTAETAKKGSDVTGSTAETAKEGSDVTGSTAEATKEGSDVTGSTAEATKEGSDVTGSTVELTKEGVDVTGCKVGTTKEGSDVTGTTKGKKGTTTVSCFKSNFKAHLLMVLIMAGVVAGFGLGYGIRALEPSDDALMWIGLPGEMYMRLLQMMILPLIICSVITGTASVDPKCNGRVSVAALTYIMVTNTFPCLLAMALAFAIKPGEGMSATKGDVVAQTDPENIIATQDIFADLIRNIAPSNLITACFQQAQTMYAIKEEITIRNVSGVLENITTITKTRVPGASNSPNALGLVLCCMMFGIAISVIGEAAKPFFVFFEAATTVIFKILNWLIWYTPIGVLSLIAVAIARADNILDTFRSLGLFAITVVAGLLLYQFIILPLGILALTRQNPYKIQMEYSRAWMVTFAAASSAVAMPEGLLALERLRVDKRVAQFVVPLATATNRDGSTMFMAAACIFICQIEGIEVDGGKVITIWILTAALSLAIPAIPSSSIVCIIIILSALGIPIEQTGLLFAIDWFLDRMRGGVNQISIGYSAVVAYHFSKSVLPKDEDEDHGEHDFEV